LEYWNDAMVEGWEKKRYGIMEKWNNGMLAKEIDKEERWLA